MISAFYGIFHLHGHSKPLELYLFYGWNWNSAETKWSEWFLMVNIWWDLNLHLTDEDLYFWPLQSTNSLSPIDCGFLRIRPPGTFLLDFWIPNHNVWYTGCIFSQEYKASIDRTALPCPKTALKRYLKNSSGGKEGKKSWSVEMWVRTAIVGYGLPRAFAHQHLSEN